MPKFNYICTASIRYETAEDGSREQVGHETHPIDIPQERIDGREGFQANGQPIRSRMGSLGSPEGEPPKAIDCPEHGGWALLAPD